MVPKRDLIWQLRHCSAYLRPRRLLATWAIGTQIVKALRRFKCSRRGFRIPARRITLARLLAVSLSLALPALPEQAFAKVPQGVFSLLQADSHADPATFTNPDVDGVSIRQHWVYLEPSEGNYDWSYLDTMVAKAVAGGKKVLLRIGTGGKKPRWVMQAVRDAGGKFFTFDGQEGQVTIPVFWDQTYLAKKKAMITKLGAHFTNNPAVRIVTASFANANSEDWAVPHTSTEIAQWLALGYTSDKMLAAGKEIIDTTMIAFPNQHVALAVGPNGHVGTDAGPNLDPDRDYVARKATLAARARWPGRLIVQKNILSATTPRAPGTGSIFQILWNSRPDVAGQMLSWAYQDSTFRLNGGVRDNFGSILQDAIDLGLGYEMRYIEIYETDILNLPNVIKYAHSALN